tara:strand:- start:13573 stop:13836 length:264 start_codon:yes stop_codon:yes gene_type:complete
LSKKREKVIGCLAWSLKVREKAGVAYDFRDGGGVLSNHRCPSRHSFQNWKSESFRFAWKKKRARVCIYGREFRFFNPTRERNSVLKS